MSDLILFGSGQIAEVFEYYLRTDSEMKVRGFVVDDEYLSDSTFCSLPVVPLSSAAHEFPPERFGAIVALSYKGRNSTRRARFEALLSLGYSMKTYVHTKAIVATSARIGAGSVILENNVIQPFVELGQNVILWSGNHVGHHSSIDHSVFISSHVVIAGGVSIGAESFVGINSTVRDHVSIGARCVIGAGAVVLKGLGDDALVVAPNSRIIPISSSFLADF